ncbi:subclass B3 metallo-beta-lactamase [Croceicoccus naphthovorans]|uniref:Uncharacterized protein n=1 Tax=Croceicoccus naphthovorans TaxID=1348774 RepID=A0A0G3XFZ9_9SPHN|nr:subclass B3 metallo-beta-lactamase [Croceicoccus naphthovorans]AKM10480.1 hypothetical protein AB433_11710 [Croceicoccus naphthovorans]MBB3988654.1 metallo-beta-lactamase class B [Croceicoccus naphthovorans]
MSVKVLFLTALAFASTGCATAAAPEPPAAPAWSEWTAQCTDWDEWDKPAPPWRIHGDTYYVGTCGIAAIVIAGDDGHVLIDTGTEAGADVVLANIRRLGFEPADIRVILASHEHPDHIGGLAKMQLATGARIEAGQILSQAIETGLPQPGDPQTGLFEPMAPATVSRVVEPRGVVSVGDIRVTYIPSPGHTPGAASWTWQSCEGAECVSVVYADSLSPVSSDEYRFSGHPDYVAAYRASLADVAALDCDLLLTPHPSASQMPKRMGEGSFIDGDACKAYAMGIETRLSERLAKEAAQ